MEPSDGRRDSNAECELPISNLGDRGWESLGPANFVVPIMDGIGGRITIFTSWYITCSVLAVYDRD